MKGIILAGGKGTRLYPLTKVVNKNILPIYDKPLIYYPILTLKNAGVKDILVISGPGHAGQFLDLLGSGRELGVDLSYDIQEEPKGIPHGLAIAEDFADEEPIALILGDNIYEENLKQTVDDFKKQLSKRLAAGKQGGAKITLKQVHDPERFGVAGFEGDKLINIIEKPKKPESNWIVTGFYLYDNQVFDVIKNLKISVRGEYEVTDLNNWYLKKGALEYYKTKGEWIDAGTFDSLLRANNFIAEKEKK